MNKYLLKLASFEDENDKDAVRAGLALTHFSTGIPVFTHSHNYIADRSINNLDKPSGNVDKRTIRRILKADKNLDVTFSRHKATKGTGWSPKDLNFSGPAFIEKDNPGLGGKHLNKNYIHTKGLKNMDVLIHELGHLKATKSGKFQSNSHNLNIGSNGGSLVGSAMLLHPETSKYAWMAPLAGVAPVVYSEGVANHQGYKLLKQHGTKLMANRFLKGIAARNMIGYAGGAVTNSAYLYGLHRLGKHLNNEK